MKRLLNGRSVAYIIALILVILLLRAWVGNDAAREVIRDLTMQLDSSAGVDTVYRVDTVHRLSIRETVRRVYVTGHGDGSTRVIDSLLSILSTVDTVTMFTDTLEADSVIIWYDAYITGNLHAISIGYELPPPLTISELLTITKTVQDVRARVWLGAFTDRRLNRYGVSLSVAKQRFQIGTLYDVNGRVLMMEFKCRLR